MAQIRSTLRQILRDSAASLRVDWLTELEAAVAADPVTITITDSAGTAMTSVAAPAEVQGASPAKSSWTVALTPANLASLDVYDFTWIGTIAGAQHKRRGQFEVVDAHLFTVAELREEHQNVKDTTNYPNEKAITGRDVATQRLEELCGVAFRRRAKRVRLNGTGRPTIILPDLEPRRIVAAKIDPDGSGLVALTADELADLEVYPSGLLARTGDGEVWTAGVRNVEIFYEYGLDVAAEPVRRAAMALAERYMVQRQVPNEGVTSITTAEGTFRLSVEGRDGLTGIPEVDAVIDQFGYRRPALGSL